MQLYGSMMLVMVRAIDRWNIERRYPRWISRVFIFIHRPKICSWVHRGTTEPAYVHLCIEISMDDHRFPCSSFHEIEDRRRRILCGHTHEHSSTTKTLQKTKWHPRVELKRCNFDRWTVDKCPIHSIWHHSIEERVMNILSPLRSFWCGERDIRILMPRCIRRTHLILVEDAYGYIYR